MLRLSVLSTFRALLFLFSLGPDISLFGSLAGDRDNDTLFIYYQKMMPSRINTELLLSD